MRYIYNPHNLKYDISDLETDDKVVSKIPRNINIGDLIAYESNPVITWGSDNIPAWVMQAFEHDTKSVSEMFPLEISIEYLEKIGYFTKIRNKCDNSNPFSDTDIRDRLFAHMFGGIYTGKSTIGYDIILNGYKVSMKSSKEMFQKTRNKTNLIEYQSNRGKTIKPREWDWLVLVQTLTPLAMAVIDRKTFDNFIVIKENGGTNTIQPSFEHLNFIVSPSENKKVDGLLFSPIPDNPNRIIFDDLRNSKKIC